MSQQSVIFAALFLGFVIFITARGRLPAYLALFWSKSAASTTSVPSTQFPTVTPPTTQNSDNPSSYNYVVPGL